QARHPEGLPPPVEVRGRGVLRRRRAGRPGRRPPADRARLPRLPDHRRLSLAARRHVRTGRPASDFTGPEVHTDCMQHMQSVCTFQRPTGAGRLSTTQWRPAASGGIRRSIPGPDRRGAYRCGAYGCGAYRCGAYRCRAPTTGASSPLTGPGAGAATAPPEPAAPPPAPAVDPPACPAPAGAVARTPRCAWKSPPWPSSWPGLGMRMAGRESSGAVGREVIEAEVIEARWMVRCGCAGATPVPGTPKAGTAKTETPSTDAPIIRRRAATMRVRSNMTSRPFVVDVVRSTSRCHGER